MISRFGHHHFHVLVLPFLFSCVAALKQLDCGCNVEQTLRLQRQTDQAVLEFEKNESYSSKKYGRRDAIISSRQVSLCQASVLYTVPPSQSPSDWAPACVWSQQFQHTLCLVAPEPDNVFGYVHAAQYESWLNEFREKIGCNKIPPRYLNARPAPVQHEVYFCRERCTDLGLSFASWMCLYFTLLLSCLYVMVICER